MGARAEPLKNSQGQVTQAVFIFTSMLRKLLLDEKPTYVAAVFESGEKTFRHDDYADYKANRTAMPEELESQLPYIVRVCEAYSIPILSAPKFEADDVIGTLAVQGAERGLRSVIVSNDKDMCQLVRDPFIVCMRQNSQNVKRKVAVPPIEWCDEAWVERKFGVPPSQIIDLLGLMGDSVDNIPGAPGIGEKGALKLIQQFGSIEGALTNWEQVTHKTYRESLHNNVDLIRKSRELATIRTDVDIALDLDQLRAKPPNRAAAYKLFSELEFHTLTREFSDGIVASVETEHAPVRYRIIRQRAELDALVRGLWDVDHWGFAVADSTPVGEGQQVGSNSGSTATGVAISTGAGIAVYVDLEGFEEGRDSALEPLRDVLANGLISKSVHDLKRAYALLAPLNIELEGVKDDTLLAAYLLDTIRSRYELIDLAREAVGTSGAGNAPSGWNENQWRAAEAADLTAQTAHVLHARIVEQGLEAIYTDMELPLAPLLYRMEKAGLKVDTAVLADLSEFLGTELDKLTQKIYQVAGREFKINSPKQVGDLLEELNITAGRKTSTGRISTSKAVLEELAQSYELPRLVIEYRELDKLKSVYTDSLPGQVGEDGRIHSQLNQTVAATGRLSSTDPNLQNIPIRTELGRRIRRAFIPERGFKFISADYSQLELRLLAHITHDPEMVDAFQKDDDIHSRTARLVFGANTPEELKEARRLAKIVNFAIAYAVEPFGLSQRVGISRKAAKQVIDDYFNTYKGVKRFMEEVPVKAREQGFICSIYGRKRPLPGINDRNGTLRGRAEREAINMPIQGTASDIVKLAMLKVDDAFRRERMKSRMVMQVHDELLVEAPEDEVERASEILRREMENAVKLDVALKADVGVGDNWMETKG